MSEKSPTNLRIAVIVTIVIILLLIYMPAPAFSQQSDQSRVQDLIVNGSFEGGFQEEFGIGYGWGGFSNGNAVVGWNFDDWQAVVADGDYSQRIEIRDALSQDRYAGIYQTLSVVPGEQYKLSVSGLIRSEEGDISQSNYGYRLQYAVDYNGGVAWELIEPDAWQEFPWDETALNDTGQSYEFETFETTVTAQSDQLTIFIRGWKKWLNDGVGIYNLDDISFVGPAPTGFQAPTAQEVSADGVNAQASESLVTGEPLAQVSEHDADMATEEVEAEEAEEVEEAEEAETEAADEMMLEEDDSMAAEPTDQPETEAPVDTSSDTQDAEMMDTTDASSETSDEAAPEEETLPLPVSGLGTDNSVIYVMGIGIFLLFVLFVGAVTATMRRR